MKTTVIAGYASAYRLPTWMLTGSVSGVLQVIRLEALSFNDARIIASHRGFSNVEFLAVGKP